MNRHPTRFASLGRIGADLDQARAAVPRAGLIARAGLLQQRSRMLASASRRQAEPQAPHSEREQAVLRLLPTPADGARDISPRRMRRKRYSHSLSLAGRQGR